MCQDLSRKSKIHIDLLVPCQQPTEKRSLVSQTTAENIAPDMLHVLTYRNANILFPVTLYSGAALKPVLSV